MTERVVIVGAGHGGVTLADALRRRGWSGEIVLVDSDDRAPYERPPLSKHGLTTAAAASPTELRAPDFYRRERIALLTGVGATAIDRAAKTVALSDASALPYTRLVLATGGRNRRLPVPGADAVNVVGLRTADDAVSLAAQLAHARRIVVVGAGFIGVEAAFAARRLGKDVVVLEAGARPLARVASPVLSEHACAAMARAGIDFRPDAGVAELAVRAGAVHEVRLADGERVPADAVVVGIGIEANDELARAAGLEVDAGVVVDATLRTSDPDICAIGDCAVHPSRYAGRRVRIESVQNATDQARHVARSIAGGEVAPGPYGDAPWFWTEWGDETTVNLVGISSGPTLDVVRPGTARGSFSVFRYEGERLSGVESVDDRRVHLVARALIGAGTSPPPEVVRDPASDLRQYARPSPALST